MVDPDKHMRFSGLVKKTHLLSATVFVGFVVVADGGCTPVTCPPGYEGPLDNREGQVDPNSDAAYYCFDITPPPPPPPPDLGGIKPPDPKGPKDRDAVLRAAVFIESCEPTFMDNLVPSANAHIDATYSAVLVSPLKQAMLERVNCFKDKTNGCDAVRECLGVTTTLDDPGVPSACMDGVAVTRQTSHNDWANCAGLGLECIGDVFEPPCVPPWKTCDVKADGPHCGDDGKPRNCIAPYKDGPAFSFDETSCADYGLACAVDLKSAMCLGPGPACLGAYCTGFGPVCDDTFQDYSAQILVDFRAGIACENETTLRACVNGHEQLVDCTAQGEGFRCFGGLRPKCAYDFQCEQVDPTHVSEVHFLRPTCDGTLLTLCNSGVWTTIDCTSLGFKTCDPVRGVCTNKLQ